MNDMKPEADQQQKKHLIRDLAHELRTPLTTVKALARLLQRGCETEAERQEYLREIVSACDREIAVVLNLLDLLRVEAGALRIVRTPVDVASLVRDVAVSACPAALRIGHELLTEAPDDLPEAAADYTVLRRTLEILLENAVKHTVAGGRITLLVEAAAPSEITFSVTDNGRGIAEGETRDIFDCFDRDRLRSSLGDLTVKPDGEEAAESASAGLSLYLVRAMIERMGGSVSVESAPQYGSRFIVRLPAWDGEEETNQEAHGNRECDDDEKIADRRG